MTHPQRILLAALAPACGAIHTPVQVQKLIFLLDREIPEDINGPLYRFRPYNYGPFDKNVYGDLEVLAGLGYVEMVPCGRLQGFRLTAEGQVLGNSVILDELPQRARDYINRASGFVRSLSFSALVSAIYKAYPDMKANSIFQS